MTAPVARPARPKTTDHMKSAKAEALNEGVEVTYEGMVYTVPAQDEWDIDILDTVYDRPQVALKQLLGDVQYATFRERHSKVGHLTKIWEAITAQAGAGNS